MSELIAATELTPSTVYGYFANKDELVWAMVRETMQRAGRRMQALVAGAEGPVLAKIAALMDGLGEELMERPEDVRFMAQFDAMYAREWSAERLISLEKELFAEGFQPMTELIREGIGDGSLRGDLDPEITMHAVLNAVIAVQRRLASLGKRVEVEYGRSVDALFREATAVILRGLRA
jgi:AcrR family transcriptional regulator